MPASLTKSLPLPPAMKMDEECKPTSEKQGIVTILGSIYDTPKTASLRRTLSADMSSKKWMEQNGIYPIKKIASSQELLNSIEDSSSSSSEEDFDNDEERKHIWNSIQQAKRMDIGYENSGRFDTWGSILTSQKDDEVAKPLSPPYVHPLTKRSSSSLSEKSLEVCTESLGSETGSEGYSSYPASEAGDMDEDTKLEDAGQQQERQTYVFDREELQVPKYNYLASKKVQPRAFPPPLPSLNRQNGVSLSVRSRRDNGRLVLEAVTVTSTNNFLAQRQDGRLVLTFANRFGSDEEVESHGATVEEEFEDEEEEEEEEIMECYEEDVMDFDGENEEVKDEEEEKRGVETEKVDTKSGVDKVEFSMEQAPKMSSGVINVHKLALLFNKPIGLPNKTPTWANSFNEEVEEGEKISLPSRVAAAALMMPAPPSPPPVAAKPPIASSFNTYEYFWRAKPMETPIMKKPIAQQPLKSYGKKFMITPPKISLPNEPHEGKKAAYLGPLLKSCNEPRRSLFIWEQNCIATSS